MPNPFVSGLRQQANSATAPKNSVNEPNKHARLTHNTFDIGYPHACTMRYSDIHPFYICEGVAGDKNPLYCTVELKSKPLKSVQMSGLSMKKGYFAVPYKAMLPLNYDKIFVNPKKGDDIPDDVNSVFTLSANNFNRIFNGSNAPTDMESFTIFLHSMFVLEMFFSNGSLLNALGYKLGATFTRYQKLDENIDLYSFDQFFDYVMRPIMNEGVCIRVPRFVNENETVYDFYSTSPKDVAILCSPQRMIELMRHNPDFDVVTLGGESSFDISYSHDFLNDVFVNLSDTNLFNFDPRPLNFSRLLAYQLSTNVFFANDDVDFIYTANLYRQAQQSLLSNIGLSYSFSYNGLSLDFDVLSGRYVASVLDDLLINARDYDPAFLNCYKFIFNIFQFNKSLRFSDYFLGARLHPLAVGDVNAPVVNNNVSAIDMTKSISIQRFTNFVNKIPSNIVGYLRDMFGVSPAVDLTEPSYLAVTKSNIGGFEVENTSSDEQGKVVTNLSSSGGDFAFEVDVTDPCIIIGVAWFEQPRYYSGTIERNMLHIDRFDDFQPMLQYIGDQDIKSCELYSRYEFSEPYAYTLRNMEYKQRFAQATGGFVEFLPGWLNVVDTPEDMLNEAEYMHLNPDIIRSKAFEFDKYYETLTGLSLASYFHFAIVFHNKNNVTRPMAVAPEILA